MRLHPVFVAGEPVGWTADGWRPALLTSPSPWYPTGSGIVLQPDLVDAAGRTAALADWAQALRVRFPIPGWRNEAVQVLDRHGVVLLAIERALLRPLGLPLRSVQVNVHGEDGRGPVIWVARRARHKPVAPGRLDSLVAGGIAGDDGPFETMLRECAEEAGIPEAIARGARAAGTIETHYLDSGAEATPAVTAASDAQAAGHIPVLHRERLQVYDLRLPERFTPRPVDGEHEAVFAMTPAELAASIARDASIDWTREGAAASLAFLQRTRLSG